MNQVIAVRQSGLVDKQPLSKWRYRVRSPASVFCFKAQKGPMVRGGAAECRNKTVREPLWGVFFFFGGGVFFFLFFSQKHSVNN